LLHLIENLKHGKTELEQRSFRTGNSAGPGAAGIEQTIVMGARGPKDLLAFVADS
jgi:hypothetical protein